MEVISIAAVAVILVIMPVAIAAIVITFNQKQKPKVGVAVIINKDGKVLLGKRIKKLGAGTFQLPGGHLERFEDWETCARREVQEEAGLQIKNVHLFIVTNNIWRELGKHYVTIFMAADWDSGEAIAGKGHESAEWAWYDLKNLPEPLFESGEALGKYRDEIERQQW